MNQPGGIIPDLSQVEQALINSFGLTDAQRATIDGAFHDAPQGLIVVALACRSYGHQRGTTGAGLLMNRVGKGEHFDEELKLNPEPKRPRVTGWRYARGSHSGTYVHDPSGTDVPPHGYSSG
jgi:hypothetical protein